MKYLIVFILTFSISSRIVAQNACDNHNVIKGKTQEDFTDVKRLKIYWAKRCACESGAITGGTLDYTIELINNNHDWYHERRNKFPEQYSYNGSLIPNKKMSVSDCKNNNNLHINDAGKTNCGTKTFDSNTDPQNYGNAYMLARCQCLEGVPFESQAKELEATMKINRQNCKTYYGNYLGTPAPLSWTDCPILQFGQDPDLTSTAANNSSNSGGYYNRKGNDRWAMYKDDLINDNARSIIGQLASESDIPELKQLSQDLDNLSMPNQQLANYNDFFNITPTQSDLEFQNVMTNVAQGVAIIKFFVNLIDRKIREQKEKKRRALEWEKQKAITAVQRIAINLRSLHREAAKIPSFSDYDDNTLIAIDKLEENFYAFDIATAPERKFLIEYLEGNVGNNVEEIQNRVMALTNMDRITLLREIDTWQQRHPELKESFKFGDNADAILANADISFLPTKNVLNGYRSICYTNLGDTEKAKEYRKNIDSKEVEDLLFNNMKTAVYNNDKGSIDELLPDLKMYLETKRLSGNASTTREEKRILSKVLNEETVLLFANGIRTSIELGNIQEAEDNILFLKQGLGLMDENRELGYKEKEYASVVYALEAMILIKKGDFEEGKKMIEKSIARASSYSASRFWKNWIKFNLLVELKEYDNAHRCYNETVKDYSYIHHGDAPLFNINELKFAKCMLLFDQGEYDRALTGLSMLETASPNIKYNQLRYKIYLQKGQQDLADAELLKINL